MKRFDQFQIGAFVVGASLFCSTSAMAEYVVRIGVESGGDQIIEVRTNNGSEELKGGGLVHLEVGARGNLITSDPAWETEGTAGYKFDSANFQNGDMEFTRFTLNLMQYYRVSPVWRFGGGVTYHLNGEVDVDIPGIAVGNTDVDNTLGFMVAADYTFSETLNAGVRATQIDYEASDIPNSDSLSGDSVGLYISLNF